MADEIIGSVGVEARLDYSDLGADFEKAIALAVSSGSTLAEAIAAALKTPDSTGVTEAFTQVGQAATMAAEQLSLFGAAEDSIPFENSLGQLNMFATELESVSAAESKAADNTEQMGGAFATIQDWLAQAGEGFRNFLNVLDGNTEGFQKFADGVGEFIAHPLRTAGEATTDFIKAVGPLGVAAVGAAAGVAELGKEALSLVSEFGAAAESTQNLADRLNLSFQATRELQDMAQIAGISIESLQASSRRLALALEDAGGSGKKVAAALDSVGVSGRTTGELLTNFLAKLAEIPDDTQRLALASEVLGRSANQIIPLIKNYGYLKDQIAELGPVIDDQMAGKLQKADDALDKLHISWTRFKELIAVGLAPALTGFIDELTRAATGLALLFRGLQEGKLHFADFAKAAIAGLAGGPTAAAKVMGDAVEKSGMQIAGASKLIATDYTGALSVATSKLKEHHKGLTDLSDDLALLVAQEHIEIAAKKSTIEEAAQFNEKMGASLTVLDYLATKTAAAALAMTDLSEVIAPMQFFGPIIEKTGRDMAVLADEVVAADQKILEASPWAALEEAADFFGIKTVGTLQEIADKAGEEYEKMKASGKATYDELSIAALKTAQDEIDAAVAAGEITRAEYDKTTAQIQADLATLEDTTKRTMGHQRDAIQQVNQAISRDLAKALTDLIFQTGKVGDAFKKMGMDVVDIIVNHIISNAIKPLLGALDQVLAKIPGIGGALGGIGGGGGAAAGGGGGAAGGAGAAVGSALSGVLGFATLGVQIVSGIVSGIQQAHMSSDLQKIEESTRYLKGYTGEQADSLLATSHIQRDTLYQILAALDGVVKINLDGKLSTDEANQLVDNLLNGSLNFYQRTFDVFTKLLQATTSGFAQVVGQLNAIGKDLNPPLWKSLLGIGGGVGGGIGGGIGGAISGLGGSLLSSIVGLFTGGGTNWEQLIEENTRVSKILLDQNLNTIAVQSVLQTGDLDDIKSTLWKIRDAVTQSTGGALPSSGEAAAVTVHVHQPRIGRMTDPGEVASIFQEGVNQARAAGAFRLGVFPV